nr:unnamed protein product [Digitaria exilis]
MAAMKQKTTNSAVALGSLQLSRDCSRSPCVARSPTTVWILPATLRSRSYRIRTMSGGRDVGKVSNSSSSSSGWAVSACERRVSMCGGCLGRHLYSGYRTSIMKRTWISIVVSGFLQ